MSDGALWIVGGLDPSGGAGVLRDVATVRAFAPSRPVHIVVTTLTQQGTGQPARARVLGPDALAFQVRSAPPAAAIKVGLVPAAAVEAVTALLRSVQGPRIVDPVLSATAGGDLGTCPEALRPLFAGALVTPNHPELEALEGHLDTEAWRRKVGATSVLVKGGHLKSVPPSDRVSDVLYAEGGVHRFERPRVGGQDPRGTGCALATAIACGAAEGLKAPAAVAAATAWLDDARRSARKVGDQVLLPGAL